MKNLDLNWFDSPTDQAQLQRLTEVIDGLANSDLCPEDFEELLRVFERFPDDDGFESFWSIVHCLEAFDGYEPALLASVRRKPVEFNVLMINRLLNAGIAFIGEQSLIKVLESVANCEGANHAARRTAVNFLEYQRKAMRG